MMSNRFDMAIGNTYIPWPMKLALPIISAFILIPALVANAEEKKPNQKIVKTSSSQANKQIEVAIAAKAAKLPLAKKKEESIKMLSKIRSAETHAEALRNAARSSRDIVQLNCVNDKLVKIRVLLKIGQKASLEMFQEIAKDKPVDGEINFKYTNLAQAYQRTLVLRSAADKCVGEATIYSGDTEVEVTRDGTGDLDDSDPTSGSVPSSAPITPEVASGS